MKERETSLSGLPAVVPRYTSYPTAADWESIPDASLLEALGKLRADDDLSIYVHIPFCHDRCHFCGCNVIVSRRKEITEKYLDSLCAEIRWKTEKITGGILKEIHFGGGTPNVLSADQLRRILAEITRNGVNPPEISMEIDPMAASRDSLRAYHEAGVTRVSFGIQDMSHRVLEAVNRPQDPAHMAGILSCARELGFQSVNWDFINGLPFQTEETWNNNLTWIRKYRPERLAVYTYAHLPQARRNQRHIHREDLPDPADRERYRSLLHDSLLSAGYQPIGMDHYALPSDPLALAAASGRLNRNFMGYTPHPDRQILAFGVSGISRIGNVFAQNVCSLPSYRRSIAEKTGLFDKGKILSDEDLRREFVISGIMNRSAVDATAYREKFGRELSDDFRAEIARLSGKPWSEVTERNSEGWKILPLGSGTVRQVASVFDAYFQRNRLMSAV